MVNNVRLTKLPIFVREGGDVLRGLRTSDDGFQGFGEIYFSYVEYGFIKGWKRHNEMTMNLIVPMGSVKFVLCMDNGASFSEYVLGSGNHCRLTIPPKTWFAFQGLSSPKNLVVNVADIEHSPDEQESVELNNWPYAWSKQ